LTPVVAVAIGILVMHDPISHNLLVGGTLTLAGVFLVAMRENKSLPADAVAGTKIG
jgi:O-acetylserine/cysteine efflux transporter